MSPVFWHCLLAAELSPAKSRAIVASLGDARFDPVAFLLTHPQLTETERERVRGIDFKRFETALQQGVELLLEPQFPESLLESPGCPLALFTWGDSSVLQTPCIAIVGTRGASSYGKAAAMKFAESLARAGVTIVSGGALGIDAAAHEGALSVEGKTIAVLAGGVDRVYPPKHVGLFQRIRENGCLLSQFSVGTKLQNYHFNLRNELMAMLCKAVLVIEAPLKSGALGTASAAAELGKPVFAVPATIDRESFRGSHMLIREGATLVDHPDQILQELNLEADVTSNLSKKQSRLPLIQESILKCLNTDPLPLDKLYEQLKLEPSELLAELTVMELDGHILRDGLGYAKRL